VPEQVSYAAVTPRDPAPAVDIGVGADTSGSTPIGNSVLGDAATGTQVVLGSAPGVNATVPGQFMTRQVALQSLWSVPTVRPDAESPLRDERFRLAKALSAAG
jgi:hypothetical protein